MDPEIVGAAADPKSDTPTKRSCDKCGSTKLSITPVPGMWLQYWCDACDNWWWETREGKRIGDPEPS